MFWLGGIFALSLVWRFFTNLPETIGWYDIFQVFAWTAFGFFALLIPLRNWTESEKFNRFVVLGMKISVGAIVLGYFLQHWIT